MAVQKNKFVEEWNGKREITEKTFGIEFGDVPTFVMTILVFPYTIYTWTRSEFHAKGDRRYQDVIWEEENDWIDHIKKERSYLPYLI